MLGFLRAIFVPGATDGAMTVMTTLSILVAPLLSVTVRVALYVPTEV